MEDFNFFQFMLNQQLVQLSLIRSNLEVPTFPTQHGIGTATW